MSEFAVIMLHTRRPRLSRKTKKALKQNYFALIRNVAFKRSDGRNVRRKDLPVAARRAENRCLRGTKVSVCALAGGES